MEKIDVVALTTVLLSSGTIAAIIQGVGALFRHINGREAREQISNKRLKIERDDEWMKRVTLGEAYARTRTLAIEAGADPAELALIDKMVKDIYDDE